MATVTSKLMELLRNLKSDAVPKPPRNDQAEPDSSTDLPTNDPETGNSPRNHKKETDNDYEEIVFGDDDFVKEKKKSKFPFKTKKDKGDQPKDPKASKSDKNGVFCSVNTQATGTVYNVVNSKNVQFGNNNVYHMSANKTKNKHEEDKFNSDDNDDESYIQKDNCIALLMESDIEPSFKYLNFISKNLGRNWKAFYTSLGYLKGYVDTLVLENGIIEARYKLLDDWVKNDDNGSLGRLATLLWDAGERQIVRELSLIYNESKKFI